jgi:hypothetical protein
MYGKDGMQSMWCDESWRMESKQREFPLNRSSRWPMMLSSLA